MEVTAREREIAGRTHAGRSNVDARAELFLSTRTVPLMREGPPPGGRVLRVGAPPGRNVT
ncbi:hypothetical protein [Actinoplanes sp. NPDC020271]|uniref:hypothetical protein n=1 Tax=Actinoplanes sp. NPDC020271 TaxID=3363896 RepID=UPI00378DE9C8